MPFLLRKDGPVNDSARVVFPYVTFTNDSEIDFSADWEIEIEIAVTGADLPFLSDDFDSSKLLFFRAGNRLEFRSSKFSTLQITFAQSYAERHTYRIVSNPSLSRVEVYQDGVLGGTISGNSLDSYDTIFNFGNSSRLGDLYSLKFYKDGVLERDYTKQAVVGGNDTEFTDQENAQNGTLVDFPTDNSQWVFYSDSGGPAYSMTLEGGDYSLIGGSASLLTNRVMQLDAGAYSLTGGGATLVANRAMQLSQGSYSYAGGSAPLLVNRSISLQSGNYTYTGGSAALTYNQSGGATYTLSLEGGDYTVNAGSAEFLVNRTMKIDGGAYAISDGSSSALFNRKMQLDGAAYLYAQGGVTILARRRMTLEGSSYNYDDGSVTLSYSGEVIALISGYTVQYKSDDVSASYIDDYIKARFQ